MLGAVQSVKHKSCNELTTNPFDFVNAFYFAAATFKSKVQWVFQYVQVGNLK